MSLAAANAEIRAAWKAAEQPRPPRIPLDIGETGGGGRTLFCECGAAKRDWETGCDRCYALDYPRSHRQRPATPPAWASKAGRLRRQQRRAQAAARLHDQGSSYRQIARWLGYHDAVAAFRAVQRILRRRAAA